MPDTDGPGGLVPYAHTADMLRVFQKDEYYGNRVRTQIFTTLEKFVGHRFAVRWQAETLLLADTLFLFLTQVLCNRTLGDEYCELFSVTTSPSASTDALQRIRPSKGRQLVAMLLRLYPMYGLRRLVPKFLAKRQARLQRAQMMAAARSGRMLSPAQLAEQQKKDWMKRLYGGVMEVVPTLLRLHLAGFYLFGGSYHQLAKRVMGIRYVTVSARPTPNISAYWYLGVFIAIEVAVTGGRKFWGKVREVFRGAMRGSIADGGKDGQTSSEQPQAEEEEEVDEDLNLPPCHICMCPCNVPTATPCGHIYCWGCIANWCAAKPSCPLCRTAAPPQQLLPIYHYEMSSQLDAVVAGGGYRGAPPGKGKKL